MSLVVDSSVWLEFFFQTSKKEKFSSAILSKEIILVPALVLFEVYKKIKRSLSEAEALLAIAQMKKEKVIALDEELALLAADLAIENKLGMADAIVYATARRYQAQLITADNDFRGLPQVTILD